MRVPLSDATSTEPPSSFSTTGSSAAASAWTSDPTDVPRLRIVGWATYVRAQPEQGLGLARRGVGEHVAVPGQRTDAYAVGSGLDSSQVGQAVDVDQHRRGGEPHGQERDEALPAREHLGARVAGQGLQCLLEGPRPAVGEGRRLHVPRVVPDCGGTSPSPWTPVSPTAMIAPSCPFGANALARW